MASAADHPPDSHPDSRPVCHFVDEAGDLTLFDSKGRVVVGSEGVSKCFMVGLAYLPDPTSCERALRELRLSLLADPYFRNVPSMQVSKRKTAAFFHAKNDLPEVRREVFKILPGFGAKLFVAVRRKSRLVEQARRLFSRGKKLGANDVYDDLVKRLLRNRLHLGSQNQIVFARRGKSDRHEALAAAIEKARVNFAARHGARPECPTSIQSAYPSESAGLQVVDYYLWAIQRLFERGEDRFF